MTKQLYSFILNASNQSIFVEHSSSSRFVQRRSLLYKILAFTFVWAVVLTGTRVQAQCVADESNVTSFNYNGKTYEIVKEAKTWADAVACAVERGGTLAVIDDAAEQTALETQLASAGIDLNATASQALDGGDAHYLWLGGNDIATEGTWIWDGTNSGSGTTFWQGTNTGTSPNGSYTNWGSNTSGQVEPDNFGSGQNALAIALNRWPVGSPADSENGTAYQWNDLNAANNLFFIIEKPTATIDPSNDGPGGVSTTSLQIWLDAGQGITVANGEQVMRWDDISGKDHHFTEATAPTLTTNVLNGNPVVSFESPTSQAPAMRSTYNGVVRSVFLVYNDVSTQIWATPFGFTDNGAFHGGRSEGSIFNSPNTNINIRNGDNFANGIDIGNGTSYPRPDNFEIHSHVFLNDLSGPVQIGRDRNFSSRGIDGGIAEVIVFSDTVSEAERIIVENYLSAKYNIALDANDVYAMDDAANGDYDHEVAGIGQGSDGSNVTNSKGSGIVQVSGATDLGNGEYLMWGHDNGSVRFSNTTDVPSTIDNIRRLDRIWAVGETGDVGTVNMKVNLTGLTNANDNDELILLVSNTPAFTSNNVLISSGSFDGTDNTVTFSVDLSDRQYFSVADTNFAVFLESIVRKSPTNEVVSQPTSIQFQLTFSEDVINVDASDFEFSGITGAFVAISGSGAVYEVTLSGSVLANANAVVGLSINASTDIIGVSNNPLSTRIIPFLNETYSLRSPNRLTDGPGGIGIADGFSDLELWLDASNSTSLTLSGSNVSQWRDLSGNDNHANQTNAGIQPLTNANTLNGNNVITFEGNNNNNNTGDGFNLISGLNTPDVSFYIVENGTGYLLASGNTRYFDMWENDGRAYLNYNGNVSWSSRSYRRPIEPTITGMEISPSGFEFFDNGISQYTTTTSKTGSGFFNRIGLKYNPSSTVPTWTGDIAEIIVYNKHLSEAEDVILLNHLSAKYNIALGSNDVYAMDDAANGDYDYEVAGIGQGSDRLSVTNSKGSGIVQISGATDLGEGEYLMWGHDNGDVQFSNTTDVPSTTDNMRRLDRIWAVSETGDVGIVNIKVDITGTTDMEDNDRLLLLLSNTPTFASSDDVLISKGVFNNVDNNVIFSANINDRQYFSVAKVADLPIFLESIRRNSPTDEFVSRPTSIQFQLTFSEDVINVDASDFEISGIAGASVAVSGSGAVYEVTLSGTVLANVDAVVGLSLAPSTDIVGVSNNLLDVKITPFFNETYSVDNLNPVLISSNPADNEVDVKRETNPFTLILKFSEKVKVGSGNITIYSDTSLIETIDIATANFSIDSIVVVNLDSALYDFGTGYDVRVDPTAITDLVDKQYAGINDATTLNFRMESEASAGQVLEEITSPSNISIVENYGRPLINFRNLFAAFDIYTITTNNDDLVNSYSIGGPDVAFFTLDEDRGVVRMVDSAPPEYSAPNDFPDFETQPEYRFTVAATDGVNTITKNVVLTVIDREEVSFPRWEKDNEVLVTEQDGSKITRAFDDSYQAFSNGTFRLFSGTSHFIDLGEDGSAANVRYLQIALSAFETEENNINLEVYVADTPFPENFDGADGANPHGTRVKDSLNYPAPYTYGQPRDVVEEYIDLGTNPFQYIAVRNPGASGEAFVNLSEYDLISGDDSPLITTGLGEGRIYLIDGRTGQLAFNIATEGNEIATYEVLGADGGDFSVTNTGEVRFPGTPDFDMKQQYDIELKVTDVNGKSGTRPLTVFIDKLITPESTPVPTEEFTVFANGDSVSKLSDGVFNDFDFGVNVDVTPNPLVAGAFVKIDLGQDRSDITFLKIHGWFRFGDPNQIQDLEIYVATEAEGDFISADNRSIDGTHGTLVASDVDANQGASDVLDITSNAVNLSGFAFRYIAIRQSKIIELSLSEVALYSSSNSINITSPDEVDVTGIGTTVNTVVYRVETQGATPATYEISGADAAAFGITMAGEVYIREVPDIATKPSYQIDIKVISTANTEDLQSVTINVTKYYDVLVRLEGNEITGFTEGRTNGQAPRLTDGIFDRYTFAGPVTNNDPPDNNGRYMYVDLGRDRSDIQDVRLGAWVRFDGLGRTNNLQIYVAQESEGSPFDHSGSNINIDENYGTKLYDDINPTDVGGRTAVNSEDVPRNASTMRDVSGNTFRYLVVRQKNALDRLNLSEIELFADDISLNITSPDTVSVDENVGENAVVYTITLESRYPVTYSITGTDVEADLLALNATTGAVTLVPNPDFESGKTQYDFTINATSPRNTATKNVVITVNDLPEPTKPLIISASTAQLNENVGENQEVYTVKILDESIAPTFALGASGEKDNDDFSIDANTGIVSLIPNPDFETKSSYMFDVIATVAGEDTTKTITLSVIDLDEVPPFLQLNGEATIDLFKDIPYTEFGVSVTDNVDGTITDVEIRNEVDITKTGIYQVVYKAQDRAGNADSIIRTVNVILLNTNSPVITLNGEQFIDLSIGQVYKELGATATDVEDGDLTDKIIISGVESINTNELGQYEVTYRVEDSGRLTATITRFINVSDFIKPEIILLGDALVIHEAKTPYEDAGVAVSDNSGANLLPQITSTVNIDVPGEYTITYKATDLSGNEADSVVRTVRVVDTAKPVISLIGGSFIEIVKSDTETYTGAGFTATDAVDGDISDRVTVVGENTVDLSVVGVYTISYNVSDLAGNAADEVTRSVSVVEGNAPVITISGDQIITLEVDKTVSNSYVDAGATASDVEDDDATLTANIQTNNPVDTRVIGQYAVTYSVADSDGNTSQAIRTVNVRDTQKPVITLNGDAEISISIGNVFDDPGATASDNHDDNLAVIVSGLVNTNRIGTYTLSYSAVDNSGNIANDVTRRVNVVDDIKPVITLNNDQVYTLRPTINSYVDPGATAIDNIDGDISNNIIITGEESVDLTKPGTRYIVRFNVSDVAGNAADEVRREVVVSSDITAPVILLIGNEIITLEVGDNFSDPGATATDDIDGDITSNIVIDNLVNTSMIGSYTVTYTIQDNAGNQASVIRYVNVTDTEPPMVTLNGASTVTIEGGSIYVDAGVTITDNHDTDLIPRVVSTVDITKVGTYTVTYFVEDNATNAATPVVRTVEVVDTTEPVITLIGESFITIPVSNVDTYTDDGATAADIVDGDITLSISVSGVSEVDLTTVGIYPITYDVSDNQGNSATTVTRTISVISGSVPQISLNGTNPVTIEVNASVPNSYNDAGATANDADDGDITDKIVVENPVDTRITGEYTVIYTVTDQSGNTVQAIRTVNVVDTSKPVISLNGATSLTIEGGSAYTDAGATVTDNYDVGLTATQTSTVNVNAVGNYTVTFNVSDNSGNAADPVVRIVEVIDTTKPVITLVGQSFITRVVSNVATFSDPGVSITDAVDGDISAKVVIGGDAVDLTTVGTYVITYNVSDNAGNMADEVTRTVSVISGNLPVITLLGDEFITIEVNKNAPNSYTDAGATATDAEDGDLTSSIVIIFNSVNTQVLGDYEVRYSVTDASMNTVFATRYVRVEDTQAPEITLLGDATVDIDSGSTYTDAGVTVTDNFDDGLTPIVVSTVDVNVIGSYTVTYNAEDNSGNKAVEVVRTVNVNPMPVGNGGSTGTFGDPSLWVLNRVPGSKEEAIITGGIVTLMADAVVGSIDLRSGTLDLNGFTLTLDDGCIKLGVGAILDASNGTVVYASDNAQCVTATQYGNLRFTGAGLKTVMGDIEVTGNFDIADQSSTVDASDIKITLGGNWSNIGTFNSNTGTRLTFNGSSGNQTITSNRGSEFFGFLVVNKTVGNVQLSTEVVVSEMLMLTSGNIVLNSSDLRFTNANASNFTGSSSAYIQVDGVGLLIFSISAEQTYTLPIGDETYYTPVTFDIISLTSRTNPQISINVKADRYEEIDLAKFPSYLNRYWTFEESNDVTSIQFNWSFTYVNEDVVGDKSRLTPIKFTGPENDVAQTIDDFPSYTHDQLNNTFTWNNLNSFSTGSAVDASIVLPVELIDLKARFDKSEGVLITWTTATEINNDYFEVQRSSDGKDFATIATVDGYGNSNDRIDYSFVDKSPMFGANFYRLNQVDFDGLNEYSNVVSAYNDFVMAGITTTVYPNPADFVGAKISVMSGDNHTPILVTICDLIGQTVEKIAENQPQLGENTIAISEELSSGTYLITISQGSNVRHERLIVR